MSIDGKAAVRAQALARRDALSSDVRQGFAQRLSVVGPTLVRSTDAPTADPMVAAFWPLRSEPDTLPLLDVLQRVGLPTALPVVGTRGTPLLFRRWSVGDPLADGRWGTRHPPATAPAVRPDVLFVPLVAFDRRGSRIGYGGGYYDATLAALRRHGPVRAIGVAFACQEQLYLPTDDHDEPLDVVVTERDIILCEA